MNAWKEVVAAHRDAHGRWILTLMPGNVLVVVDHEKFHELFPTPDDGPLGARLVRDGDALVRLPRPHSTDHHHV